MSAFTPSGERGAFSSLDERLIAAVMDHNKLSRADAIALVENGSKSSARHHALKLQWVENLADVTTALATGDPKPVGLFVSVFWIRLYGVLTELREDFAKQLPMPENPSRTLTTVVASATRIGKVCDELHACLSEEELMFISLARHTEAHMTQKGFTYGLERGSPKRGATVRTKTKLAVLGEHREVDEIEARTRGLLAAHNDDDSDLAIAIARKVKPHTDSLRFVMLAHHAIR